MQGKDPSNICMLEAAMMSRACPLRSHLLLGVDPGVDYLQEGLGENVMSRNMAKPHQLKFLDFVGIAAVLLTMMSLIFFQSTLRLVGNAWSK